MKNILLKSFLAIPLLFLFACSKEVEIPKLECTQPNLAVNQTVEKVKDLSVSVPKQYSFDDIIEGYVISTDEGGNFFKTIYLQTMATDRKPAIGFNVPVDVTNTYVDFRIGNKVYIKLKNQLPNVWIS